MTTLSKNMRDGWAALDVIPLDGERVLRVSTSKVGSGAIVTSATAVKLSADGLGFFWMMYGDFSERLLSIKERATEKTIAGNHAKAMAGIEAVKARALAFYAAKVQS